jgi:serine O-acetyltransferase
VTEKSVMAGIPAKRVGDATKGFKPYAVIDEEKE